MSFFKDKCQIFAGPSLLYIIISCIYALFLIFNKSDFELLDCWSDKRSNLKTLLSALRKKYFPHCLTLYRLMTNWVIVKLIGILINSENNILLQPSSCIIMLKHVLKPGLLLFFLKYCVTNEDDVEQQNVNNKYCFEATFKKKDQKKGFWNEEN